MTKKEIIEEIASGTGVSSASVEDVLDEFSDLVLERAKAQLPTNWPALGKFFGRYQEPRRARNPATGELVDVPGKVTLKFSPGSRAKRYVSDH